MSISVQQYWDGFLDLNTTVKRDTPYQCWFFGNTQEMALELVQLVIAGKKLATASLAAVNKIKPAEAPIPGGYSVVTDFLGTPMCVIQTTEIRHLSFEKVDAQFASDEGEGDRTLEYWQDLHRNYFVSEAAGLGLGFDERSLVCCERFKLVYPR